MPSAISAPSTPPGGVTTNLQYNNSGAFGGIPSLTYDGTIPATVTRNALGSGSDPIDGIFLQNTTLATAIAQDQISPAVHWSTQTWNGAASVPIEFGIFVGGYGGGQAAGDWVVASRINSGAWEFALDFNAGGGLPALGINGGLTTPSMREFVSGGSYPNYTSDLYLFEPIISVSTFDKGIKFFDPLGVGFVVGMQTTQVNLPTLVMIMPNGTYASTPSILEFFGTDYSADQTNFENMIFAAKGTSDPWNVIASTKGGTGTVRAINLNALNDVGVAAQLVIGTDGGVSVGTGTAAGDDNINVAGVIKIDAVQVVNNRVTGWTAPTGTSLRSGYATTTATLDNVSQTLKALIDDLFTHGLIGT